MLIKNIRNRVTDDPNNHQLHPDPNMHSAYWWNMDKAQSHYFVSVLHEHYPQMKEAFETKFEVPAGKVVWLLHRYYKIFTRDNTPAKGGWVKEDAIHELPPSMLMRPETKQ